MNQFKNIYFLALVLLSGAGWAKSDEAVLTKSINKLYTSSPNAQLSIINKYGDVIIDTWNKDSIKIQIEIKAYGKNDDAVEKLIDRVDFDFQHTQNFIKSETVFDRNSSTFSNFWKSLGDYSKTIFSQNNIKVVYRIQAPRGAHLNIDNKYGDIYLGDNRGRVQVRLSHGNIKATKLMGTSTISVNFGKATIRELHNLNLQAKISTVEIHKANQLTIESSSSEFTIGKVNYLKATTRNDRIQVTKLDRLTGNGSFTTLKIDSLNKNLALSMDFGQVDLNAIAANFSKINIVGKSTDINLKFSAMSYYSADIKAKEDRLYYPQQIADVHIGHIDQKEKIVALKGTIGKSKPFKSNVEINMKNGEVRLFHLP